MSDVTSEEDESEEEIKSTKKSRSVPPPPPKKKKKHPVVEDDEEEEDEEEEDSTDEEDEKPAKKKKQHQQVQKKKKTKKEHHHRHKEEKKKKKKSSSDGKKRKIKEEEKKPRPKSPYLEYTTTARAYTIKSTLPGFVEKLTDDEVAAGKRAPTKTVFGMDVVTTVSAAAWNLGDREAAKAMEWLRPFVDISSYLLANRQTVGEWLFMKHKDFAKYVIYILGCVKYIKKNGPESITAENMKDLLLEMHDKAKEYVPLVEKLSAEAKALADKQKKAAAKKTEPAAVVVVAAAAPTTV